MSENNANTVDQARRLRAAILQRHGYESESSVPDGESANALSDAAGFATISSHWGIVSNVPIAGRAIVLAKRLMRIGLRWYINPIVEQQNSFNDAVVRSLYELQADNDRLRADIARRNSDGSQE